MFEQSQSVYTSLAHRCWNFSWDEAKNHAVYGEQASSQGLGANWRVEIAVQSESSQDFDLSETLAFLKTKIDHRCLWVDWPEFKTQPSTLEAVSLALGKEAFARALPSGWQWAWMRVHEDEHASCTVFPERETVELEARVSNLRLKFAGHIEPESGLLMPRQPIMQAVRGRLSSSEDEMKSGSSDVWLQALFADLRRRLPQLARVQVDLSRQQSLALENP